MAGDWIKMRTGLATSPKVVRMSSALRADRFRVIGGLHAVWCLFDEHSEDGFLDGYTFETLDEMIGFPGIAAAMASVGWLSTDGDSLYVPRFDEHNGRSAKRRATETERKREERKLSASDADKDRTECGLEKRREEKNYSEAIASGASPQPAQPMPPANDQRPSIPDCPHIEVLTLWAEMLPALPQHQPGLWGGTRASHLRARWRETAVAKGWRSQDDGMAFFRKLFAYVGKSDFLTGKVQPAPGRKPFQIELEWLVNATNWARVIEGKYHEAEVTA